MSTAPLDEILWFDPNRSRANFGEFGDVAAALAKIEGAENIRDVFRALLDYVPRDRFPFVQLATIAPRCRIIASSFPRDWTDEYEVGGYVAHDPILAQSLSQPSWFDWKNASQRARGAAREIMERAAIHGLEDGVSIPYHGPRHYLAVVSMCGPLGAMPLELHERAKAIAAGRATLARTAALTGALEMGASGVHLTNREIECLRWVQRGKTDREIAEILDIGRGTAAEYVQAAMKKLGSSTRANAVALAVAEGILSLAP